MNANRKYINAVFNFDVETFKTLLNTESFDKSLLSDIKFADDAPCPIYWITQCWEIIFEHPEDWNENYRGIIAENKKRNLEIKQIFTDIYNVDFKSIDFYNTNFWFFRDERDATYEDVFVEESRNELMTKGYRRIDIDLYVAVNKFDFAEVEKLLETERIQPAGFRMTQIVLVESVSNVVSLKPSYRILLYTISIIARQTMMCRHS